MERRNDLAAEVRSRRREQPGSPRARRRRQSTRARPSPVAARRERRGRHHHHAAAQFGQAPHRHVSVVDADADDVVGIVSDGEAIAPRLQAEPAYEAEPGPAACPDAVRPPRSWPGRDPRPRPPGLAQPRPLHQLFGHDLALGRSRSRGSGGRPRACAARWGRSAARARCGSPIRHAAAATCGRPSFSTRSGRNRSRSGSRSRSARWPAATAAIGQAVPLGGVPGGDRERVQRRRPARPRAAPSS